MGVLPTALLMSSRAPCIMRLIHIDRSDRRKHSSAVRAVAAEGVEALQLVLRAAGHVLDALARKPGCDQLRANRCAQVDVRLVARLARDEADARRHVAPHLEAA